MRTAKYWTRIIAMAGLSLTLLACPEEEEPKTDAGNNTSCTKGTENCACDDGTCNDGLVCQDELCVPVSHSGLTISDDNARACEVLLSGVSKNTKVVFADSVKGKTILQGEQMAVTFFSTSDAPISGDAVTVEGAIEGTQIAKSSCFGKDGEALAGASVSF